MSCSSNKTNRNSKEDSDVLSKAVLEDNDNKLSIINRVLGLRIFCVVK